MKKIIGLLLMITLFGCTRIEVGNVGLKVELAGSERGVEDIPTVTGWVFYSPFTQTVIEYPVNVQSITWTKDVHEGSPIDESISFSSIEGLNINADIGLAYNVDATKAPQLYTKFRQDDLNLFAHGYIRNIIRDSLNDVASKMPVQDIYGAKKSQLLIEAKKRAQDILKEDGIIVDQLTFAGNLRLPQNVERAINNSIEQTQKAIAAENKVAEVKAIAEQKITTAQGDSQSVLIRAKADAEANKIISESLTPELMKYKSLTKWDGKLPQVTGNSIPMIDIESVKK